MHDFFESIIFSQFKKPPVFYICPPSIIVSIYCLDITNIYELPDIFYNILFSPSHASRNIPSEPPDSPLVIHRMSPAVSRKNF